MVLNHLYGMFTHPDSEWNRIRSEPNTIKRHYLTHAIILCAIPASCGFYSVTHIGWTIGNSNLLYKMTINSALPLCVLFYCAMITGIIILGKFIDFLSVTFQQEDRTARGIALATYTSTPLLISGLSFLYPNIWIMMSIILAAITYSVYLLYEGVPILMKIPKDQGFIFASSIVTVALVMAVSLLAITVIIWSVGIGPIFTTSHL